MPNVYNVKNFGAKGNGITDDTTAIQAAVKAAKAIEGIVFYPAGMYLIRSLPSGVCHLGDGAIILSEFNHA